MPWSLVSSLGFSAVAITVLLWWYHKTHQSPLLPPGPPRHWLRGNDFPKRDDFLQYDDWARQYGPVYSLRSWMETVIVIGGYQAAIDILEKEGSVTQDRPQKVAGGEIRSGDMRILLVGVGARLRKLRRALHAHLQPRSAVRYEDMQAQNARQLVKDILDDPTGLFAHTQRYAASVILSITYGKPSPSHRSDPDVALIYECLHDLGQSLRPGAWLCDQIPWLKHLSFYTKPLRERHSIELDLFRRQMQGVREDISSGYVPPSFGRYLLKKQGDLELSDDEIAYLAGSMFGAGADTTAAGLRFVVMAAACYPEEQGKAQDELDSIIGHDRLPSFSDFELLPRVRAFILETFRWRPGTAGGMQHRAMQDILWNGMVIPKGATIIPNHWSIGRDPEFFPQGDVFKPDRWLDTNGHIRDKPAFPNFGFGRRTCPGQPVAERSIFINTALLLQSFWISQDPARPIDLRAFRHGTITQPAPFVAKFSPRNPAGEVGLRDLLSTAA